ncbi:hypothetical protein BDR05DRAFT_1024495 [Suillus weaverae]|nr:hypothetical protein BDR05DRAFT_1024495 [Suillus weaverae]
MHSEQAPQSYSALETLVLNLRNHDGGEIPRKVLDDHTALLEELRDRVDSLAPSMNRQDAHFAQVIVSLLLDLDQLPIVSPPLDPAPQASSSTSLGLIARHPADLLSTLKKQLSDLQLERKAGASIFSPQSPVQTVQTALLWSKIDRKLETVTALCKDRADSHRSPSLDYLPPQYDHVGHDFDTPPEYDAEYQSSSEKVGIQPPRSIPSPSISNEKLRMDFDAVTLAIERLYLAAPQLHNQRVELKSAKLAQMERARLQGPKAQPSLSKGKQKAHDRDMRDLDHMLELLGKASDRKLTDQSVVMDSRRMVRLRQAKQEYEDQRGAFVDHLIQRSGAGRLHDQDAILQPKVRALDELVTLPEFIRESMSSIPPESRQHTSSSGDALEEPIPDVSTMSHKKSRSRSISAPQWLRPAAELSRRLSKSSSRPSSSAGGIALDVSYVAEYHETLRHVLVFVAVSGIPVDTELQAEVLPTSSSGTEGDWLVIRSSWASSPPLSLPVRVAPGKKDVQIRQGHYELKLGIANPQAARSSSPDEPTPLMSAEQLLSSKPTSWSCISCSLPLVHIPKLIKYRDLPSEHWEELVDAWMCHADQTLHNHVAKHGRGFWPEDSEALVGCGYILFQQSAIVSNNVSCTEQTLVNTHFLLNSYEESWLARCICGAIIGRRHERHSPDGTASVMYRLFKYAVRPVSQIVELPRFPMSAFIMQDMLEHVSAHATYRFVISDEEEERPRILVWLFKPKIRVSYMLPTPYLLPKQGSIDASKVLYRILGPSSSTMALKDLLARYPGFPQAEHLFYPIDICRKLAGLLTESTHSYPENIKTMTGLHVGWLNRGS